MGKRPSPRLWRLHPGQKTLLDLSNSYGTLQELTSRSRTDARGSDSSTYTGQFSYDKELRLTQSVTNSPAGAETETFTLDAVGNRTAHSRVVGDWTYDANNRLIQRGTGVEITFYQYDAAGNLIQQSEPGKVTQYAYDTQNRLIEIRDGGGQLIAHYGYDPFDRRIWREQYRDKNGNALAQAKRTYYLYADEGLIAEASQDITLNADQSISASTPPSLTTQYGPRPDGLFGTSVLFVKTKNTNGQDTLAYYQHDSLGTAIQALDKNGNIVWAATYNVFGQATITTPTATTDKPTITSNLRLPGQIEDAETGLHYNAHRYYDPSIDRYVTQDPIGLAGGINQYLYATNPLTQIDPLGLSARTFVIGFIEGAVVGLVVTAAVVIVVPAAILASPAFLITAGVLGAVGLAYQGSEIYDSYARGCSDLGDQQLGNLIGGLLGGGVGAKAGQVAKSGREFVDVYRVFGGDARAEGLSWTTTDPRSVSNFRDLAGLPSGGASGATNTADFLIQGKVNIKDIIASRQALPLDGNKGGLPELIIDPKNVNFTDFSVIKP